jgi:hypothetical protein
MYTYGSCEIGERLVDGASLGDDRSTAIVHFKSQVTFIKTEDRAGLNWAF